MGRILLAALVALTTGGAAMAQAPVSLVPEVAGATACWKRSYSKQHLAEHPDQLVTEMTFGAGFFPHDDPTPEDAGMILFGMEVALRGGKTGITSGQCWPGEDGIMRCGVECDGGGVALTSAGDGKLLIDLEASGYILMDGECDAGDGDSSFALEPGKDDKQFLVQPVKARLCDGLIPR